MKTITNTIIGIAKNAKTMDEYIDRIYEELGDIAIVSDDNIHVVEYMDRKYNWHSVDVSKYTKPLFDKELKEYHYNTK